MSDVIFWGIFVFLIVWSVHGLMFRWPATSLAVESIERKLAAAVRITLARIKNKIVSAISRA